MYGMYVCMCACVCMYVCVVFLNRLHLLLRGDMLRNLFLCAYYSINSFFHMPRVSELTLKSKNTI